MGQPKIHLITEQQDTVLFNEGGQSIELRLGGQEARGVMREIDDQHLCLGGDESFEFIKVKVPGSFTGGEGPFLNSCRPNDMLEDMHVYLSVTGGFLSGTVDRVNGKPTLTMRHISPDGKVRLSRQAVLEGWTAEEARSRDRKPSGGRDRPR